MQTALRVLKFSIVDQLHYRSFYILVGVSVLLVLMLRGCFENTMVMNGQRVDAAAVGHYASLAAFHVIAVAGLLVSSLLAMGMFRRDRQDGSDVFFLAKPMSRTTYLIGRIGGIWIISGLFTFVLHAAVFAMVLVKSGTAMPYFLQASILLWINQFFSITAVSLLSLLMPDVIAELFVLMIGVVSFFSDSFYAATQTAMFRTFSEQSGFNAGVSLWRLFWPKIAALQFFGVSLIRGDQFSSMGPVHPLLNMVLYAGLVLALLMLRFNREEIGRGSAG